MGTESSTSRSITSIERRTVFFLHKRNPGSYHDRHENGPQTYHDMIAVVEEWDIVRPAVAGWPMRTIAAPVSLSNRPSIVIFCHELTLPVARWPELKQRCCKRDDNA